MTLASRSMTAIPALLVALTLAPALAGQAVGPDATSHDRRPTDKVEAIHGVLDALADEPNLAPRTKDALRQLLSVMEQEEHQQSSLELRLAESFDRLTRRTDEHEQVVAPLRRLTDRLDVYGDLRLRHESDLHRDDRPSRNRQRVRLRLGANLKMNEELDLGARLVTGNPDDPNSTHQTFGRTFDSFDISLDRAFVGYHPLSIPDGWVKLGKFGHPFRTNPVYGELVWDGDVQPEGIAAGRSWRDVAGLDQLELMLGEYIVVEQSNLDEASAVVAQVSGRKNLDNDWDAFGALSYYHFENLTPDGSTAVTADNAGNALTPSGDFASRFDILNPVIAATYHGLEQPLVLSAEVIHNRGAASNRDSGWALGTAYGQTRNEGDWRWYYQYQRIEQDAVLSPFAQDDHILTTNFHGHTGGWQYQITDDTQLHLWGLVAEQLEEDVAGSEKGDQWRLRVDLNIKF